MQVAKKAKEDKDMCVSEETSLPIPSCGLQRRSGKIRRRRRRTEGRLNNNRSSWSISSVALSSMVAFLFLHHSCNNKNDSSRSMIVVATPDTSDSYEQDPQTDPWLDAEGDDTYRNIPPPVDEQATVAKKEKEPLHEERDVNPHRTMEEELQLHAEHQHNSQERINKERSINAKEQQQYQQFMDWCQQVLGIQTSLEIHTFYYYDYMTAIMTYPEEDDDNDDDDDNFQIDRDNHQSEAKANSPIPSPQEEETWQDPPMIPVRGLRATRNISQGEVIISIPFQALLTVSTTIDQDPVLSRVMGKEARRSYGWTLGQDTSNPESNDVDFFELPLLAMALLHHYKLGTSSPLYPYIHLLRKSPVDQMPFLWSKQKRKKQYTKANPVAKGVQTVARSIRLEMKDMYHTVVDTLVENHPELFGRASKQQYDTLDNEEWAFSFENFQWAFAMVNSRHWLLPIIDLEQPPPAAQSPPQPHARHPMQPQGSVDGVPPAQMPTDAWVAQEEEDEEGEEEQEEEQHLDSHSSSPPNNNNHYNMPPAYHSFLAPVADLLNFGPPCTRGRYNQDTHTFDIVASCDFMPGQEVTFWYSDECEEIIVGNYGFSHPMVPKCPTVEDYRQARDRWKQRATSLQQLLEDAYEDMDVMDTELQHVQQVLAHCDCCDTARARHYSPQQPGQHHQHQQEQHRQEEQVPSTTTKQKKEKQRPPRGSSNVDAGWHIGNLLRNPHDEATAPSQIRGGRGTMMSRNSGGSGGAGRNNNNRSSNDHDSGENRRSRGDQRSRGATSDDDVERHGVRRMWAGRSAL